MTVKLHAVHIPGNPVVTVMPVARGEPVPTEPTEYTGAPVRA